MQDAPTMQAEAIATPKPRFNLRRFLKYLGVLSLISVYLLLAPAISSEFYNANLLFMPVKYDKFNKWWHDREAQEIFFSNKKGNKLQGIYLPSEKNDRVILVHHGQSGNTDFHLANCKFLLQPQDGLFIYDYAGFGKSEGSPTIKGMADDARAAYDCLVTKFKITPKTIVHYGASLGTGPATLIASEKPCGGLILFSPYTTLKDASRSVHPFLNIYPDFLLTSYDFDTVANVKLLKAPLFLVHGVEDSAIPVRQADQIFKAAHEPKTFHRLEGQGHGLYLSDELLTDLHRFVRNLR
ncbi:MAG: alpha/beta hydrolase [Candidatus Obscuribacterales bacterium]|nr:alpha/beta hydrolase [Candidatus Obscuribacterales bacterium]